MSELSVGQLKGLLVNNNVISVPSGHSLHSPGSVIQVVSETNTLDEATSVNGLATSTYYISITPKFSTSKIYVMMNFLLYNTAGGSYGVRTNIGRAIGSGSTTDIFSGTGHDISHYSSSWNQNHHRTMLTTIDSPFTTQTVKYYVRYGSYGGGTTYLGNGRNQACNFTLMEIAQ